MYTDLQSVASPLGHSTGKSRPRCRIVRPSPSGRRDSNPRPSPWQGDALPTEPRPRSDLGVAPAPSAGATIPRLPATLQTGRRGRPGRPKSALTGCFPAPPGDVTEAAQVGYGCPSRAYGAVVARFVHTEEVTGSNPVTPTEPWVTCARAAASLGVLPVAGGPSPHTPEPGGAPDPLLWSPLCVGGRLPASVSLPLCVGARFAGSVWLLLCVGGGWRASVGSPLWAGAFAVGPVTFAGGGGGRARRGADGRLWTKRGRGAGVTVIIG